MVEDELIRGSKLHNLESIRRSPPVGWGLKRIQAYFIWAKQVTDSESPLLSRFASSFSLGNKIIRWCHRS